MNSTVVRTTLSLCLLLSLAPWSGVGSATAAPSSESPWSRMPMPSSTVEHKNTAIRAFGFPLDHPAIREMYSKSDYQFVSTVQAYLLDGLPKNGDIQYTRPEPGQWSLTDKAANQALKADPETRPASLMNFIVESPTLAAKDIASWGDVLEERRRQRLRREQLMAHMTLPADPDKREILAKLDNKSFVTNMLGEALADRTMPHPAFIKAAQSALLAGEPGLSIFINDGGFKAHDSDFQDWLQPKPDPLQVKRSLYSAAANVCAVKGDDPAKPWWDSLLQNDTDFMRGLVKKCERYEEEFSVSRKHVVEGLYKAIASTEASTREDFLRKGIHDARLLDDKSADEKDLTKLRTQIEGIAALETKAGMRPRLAAAARKAATGDRSSMHAFLTAGQFDRSLWQQSFRTTAARKSAHVLRAVDATIDVFDGAGATMETEVVGGTWTVENALAAGPEGRQCFSLSPSTRPGTYLGVEEAGAVQLTAQDGSDATKRAVTWCVTGTDRAAGVQLRPLTHMEQVLSIRGTGLVLAAPPTSPPGSAGTASTQWTVGDPAPKTVTPATALWANDAQLQKALGQPTAPEKATGAVRSRTFERGMTVWRKDVGAHWLNDGIARRYQELGGPSWDVPISDTLAIPEVGDANAQFMAMPRLNRQMTDAEKAAAAAAHAAAAAAAAAQAAGKPVGSVGDKPADQGPFSQEPVASAVLFADENFLINSSPSASARRLGTGIARAWLKSTTNRALFGVPTSDEVKDKAAQSVTFTSGRIEFVMEDGGTFVWSGTSGSPTEMVQWAAQPGNSWAGKARGPVYTMRGHLDGVGDGNVDVFMQDFDHARLLFHPRVGAHAIPTGQLLQRYLLKGGPRYTLPNAERRAVGKNGDGWAINLHSHVPRYIYWHPRTGAHDVGGGIAIHWFKNGGESGSLGFPIEDEKAVPGGWNCRFEGGWIDFTTDGKVSIRPN